MANEEDTGKSPAELADRAWKLAASMRVAMLITAAPQGQKARPMSPTVKREEHAIYFLTSVSADTVTQLGQNPSSTLAFSDSSGNKYVTFTCRGTVSNDRAKIRELWTPFAKAWWESAEDPSIRVLVFNPTHAELWDGPNMLVASAKMLAAAVTGAKPAVGDHGDVSL